MATDDLARSVYRRVAAMVERHRRRRLVFRKPAPAAGPPTVYFFTPDFAVPSGGIRVIYRHVDILNAAGMAAYALHEKSGFRCTWFEHRTQVTSLPELRLRDGDVVVLPETHADLAARLPATVDHVVFNQNSHLTWRQPGAEAAYASPRLRGIVTVSDHNAEMLRRTFPQAPVHRIPLGLDPDLFACDEAVRGRRIAYMPRRGHDDARQVLAMLGARGTLDGWQLVAVEDMSHAEVARLLRTTRIFLAFTHQEGFGLPAAEAMACGNYVIGNHGYGGQEFFRPAFSRAVPVGDILGFVEAIEEAVAADRRDPAWCSDRGRAAATFIHRRYAPAGERDAVVSLYAGFLGLAPDGPSAAEAAE